MFRSTLALLLLALPLAGQAPPPLKEVVERFDAAQAQVQTLQCPFTLTLRRALLKTPSVTKGTMYLQGSDFAHFAFQPPEDLVLHLTPKALISYSPEAREGELMKIGLIKNSDRKFLGLGQKLSYLSDYFQISLSEAKDGSNTWFLALAPRTLSLRKRMQALNLWVDKETWLPRQIQWIERSGDSWFLELGALRINQALPSGVIGFKLPEGIPLRSEFSFFATRKK
ncbi:MAG: outer membrane lipoprotein carrier protein LolA [Geothrix sp.]|uniref:LolA family protein n=1 Tax=Geothrix sp. TaxID=1962974 RepID=UPI001809231B|nr:outer membrane lipoprotein carrier protein LolA [Geothrix sp.]NWJ41201.1 outer membrane lipoprotein carrier protein LolA [Geothrix sp.]WIL20808.1 MAG: outer membrane lipoprotein carrier protein LolA [Geothrix sp.]